jgi:Protein kinase domain
MALGDLEFGDPRSIGDFRIKAVVGEGGSGRVYLGLDEDDKAAAVKRLTARPGAPDETSRERFRREIRALSKMDSALVPRLAGFDDGAEQPWLATPYIPGPSLHDALHGGGRLPVRFVWSLAAALCDALDAIHQAQMLHRDLKPSNVMVAADRFVVIDLGLTRSLDGSEPGITRFGFWAGSFGYMSPEQLRGLSEVGPPADVFSLAATVFHAATGMVPFPGQRPFGAGAAGSVPAPYPADLPAALADFLRRGLEPAEDRRATVAELQWLLPPGLDLDFAQSLPSDLRQIQAGLERDLAALGGSTYPLHSPDSAAAPTRMAGWDAQSALRTAARIAAAAHLDGETDDGTALTLRLAGSAGAADLTAAQAGPAFDTARAALPPATTYAQAAAGPLGRLAAALAQGRPAQEVVVELGPDHCAVWDFAAGPAAGREHRLRWADLLAATARPGVGDPTKLDEVQRDLTTLLLAAGPTAVPPGSLRAFEPWLGAGPLARRAAAAVRAVLDRIPVGAARPPGDVIVILRRPGWRLLEVVADELAPAATTDLRTTDLRTMLLGSPSLPEFLARALDHQPLSCPMGLAVGEVDGATGAVTLRFLELFPPGTAPTGPAARRTVVLPLAEPAADRILLPLVSRRTEHPSGWELVRTGRLDHPGPGPVTLTVTLSGRDQARMSTAQAPGGLPGEPGGWSEIRARVPHSLRAGAHPGGGPLDLVVALERGSFDGDIEARRRFCVALLEQAAQLRAGHGVLRTAVLAYGDHLFDSREYEGLARSERRRRDPELSWSGFGSARRSTQFVLQLTAGKARHDYAAPVEEALAHLLPAGWRPDAHHVVVLVGSRPPHLSLRRFAPYHEALRCTYDIDWQKVRADLVEQHNLICVAVVEPLGAHLPQKLIKPAIEIQARNGWEDLVGGGLEELSWADPAAVLETAGVYPVQQSSPKAAVLPLALHQPVGPNHTHVEVPPIGGAR